MIRIYKGNNDKCFTNSKSFFFYMPNFYIFVIPYMVLWYEKTKKQRDKMNKGKA